MYSTSIDVSVKCPVHPAFSPEIERAPSKCDFCRRMSSIYEWVRLIQRSLEKLNSGQVVASNAVEAEPVEACVVDIAPEPVLAEKPASPGPAKKRAIATKIHKAPQSLAGRQLPI